MQNCNNCVAPLWKLGVGRTPNDTGLKSASGKFPRQACPFPPDDRLAGRSQKIWFKEALYGEDRPRRQFRSRTHILRADEKQVARTLDPRPEKYGAIQRYDFFLTARRSCTRNRTDSGIDSLE